LSAFALLPCERASERAENFFLNSGIFRRLRLFINFTALRAEAVMTGYAMLLRGGSYINNARNCRSAYRNNQDASNINHNVGLRVVVSASAFRNARIGEREFRRACPGESSAYSGDVGAQEIRRSW
jgi:hypothetical protein